MYNEFAKTHYTSKWFHASNLLYNKKNLISRLYQYFYNYFETCLLPVAESLFLLVLSMLAMGSAHCIRFLYRHFLLILVKISFFPVVFVIFLSKANRYIKLKRRYGSINDCSHISQSNKFWPHSIFVRIITCLRYMTMST